MKLGIIIVVSLIPLIAACASQGVGGEGAQGITEIYSPPVRLGGQGRMIFFPAPGLAQDVPPAPPPGLTADYVPGPWSIFFDAKTDQPAPESRSALDQIVSTTSRFPTIRVYLCAVGASGSDGPGITDRKRLETVRTLLVRHGVRRAITGPDRLCSSLTPRAEPFVWAEPAID